MLKGFKEFIMKGNVIDLAVAVIMASAFGPVVTTLVEKIIMPAISGLIGFPSFDQFLRFQVGSGQNYVEFGSWITVILNFLIIAAAIYFVIVMPMNAMIERRDKRLGITPAAEEADPQVVLLTEIRDMLAQGQGGSAGSHADRSL